MGVAVDATAHLYIADHRNNVIREVPLGPGAQVAAITPALLTITANSQSRLDGQVNPALTASYSGFVNGDTPASLATPPAISTPANPGSPPGSYPIFVSGASSLNYKITFIGGTLTVIPSTPAAVPPTTVVSVSIQKLRTGKHRTTQVIVLQFSEALNAAAAQNLGNYSLGTVPKGKKHKSKPVAISQAKYDSAALTVTLFTRNRLVLSAPLQLTLKAVGLLDSGGRPLDGNRDGQPGGDFEAILG